MKFNKKPGQYHPFLKIKTKWSVFKYSGLKNRDLEVIIWVENMVRISCRNQAMF